MPAKASTRLCLINRGACIAGKSRSHRYVITRKVLYEIVNQALAWLTTLAPEQKHRSESCLLLFVCRWTFSTSVRPVIPVSAFWSSLSAAARSRP
ncbi:hypothetical protein C1X65_17905 [Pseudomonas sp. FW305-70]|nr:hypothetical protein C1X65_17905 [Pseudomonas sp. FW305-70]